VKEVHDVSVGQVLVRGGEGVLRSVALGSCIGVAAYDRGQRIGALGHIMLPGRAPTRAVDKYRYADDAIAGMVDDMIAAGCCRGRIEACLVGAGNVLEKPNDTICRTNVESVTAILRMRGIPVRASLLGGVQRKSISLDIQTGRVFAAEGDEKESLLWVFTGGGFGESGVCRVEGRLVG